MAGNSDPKPDQVLAKRFGLENRHLEATLGSALSRRADFADLYFEVTETTQVGLDEGLVKRANASISQGVGVRVLAGERTGYAHSNEISSEALTLAARGARSIASGSGNSEPIRVATDPSSARDLYPVRQGDISRPLPERVALLERIDREARGYDPRIKNVMASVDIQDKRVLIANSEGILAEDIRPMVRINVTCIAEENGARETGTSGGGGRFTLSSFLEDGDPARTLARDAARQAIVKLSAENASAGEMTVVLGPGWPGILLHEAVGHGLEGDFNRKGLSAFANRIGERVASELCTVVDDGTLRGRRGSLNMDDEGTPTARNTLIEKGRLTGYLQDRLNARLIGGTSTGNGRRESFMHAPLPRMTNTFMLAGEDAPEDILRSVQSGIYAVSFSGGQVDITNGKFVFSSSEAYRIEGGKIGAPLKGATLIGNGPDVLTRVCRVGSDLALDPGIGVCGKDGQSVPVGVGLPTIRVDGLTVGGTQP